MDLRNTVGLVTGANRGVGRAFTEALLERGAPKVYATARNVEKLSEVIALDPSRVIPLQLDVTAVEQVAAAPRAPR